MLFTIASIIYAWMGSGWGVGPSMGHALLCLGGLEVGKVIQYINLSLYSWIKWGSTLEKRDMSSLTYYSLIYLYLDLIP